MKTTPEPDLWGQAVKHFDACIAEGEAALAASRAARAETELRLAELKVQAAKEALRGTEH